MKKLIRGYDKLRTPKANMKEIENLLVEHGVNKDKASEFIEIYDKNPN